MGKNVCIVSSNWIPRLLSFKPFLCSHLPDLCVSSFILPDRSQNIAILNDSFIPIDVQSILDIRLSPIARADVLYWFFENNGIFSAKSAHKLAMSPESAPFVSFLKDIHHWS